jgi:ERF superfamily
VYSDCTSVNLNDKGKDMSENTPMMDFVAALSAAQAAIQAPKKNRKGYNYNYADLDDVIDALKQPFFENGLAFTQTIETDDKNQMHLVTTLFHKSGGSMTSKMPLPVTRNENLFSATSQDHQSLGTAITYYRRYSLMAIVGIASEDNDAASTKKEQEQEESQKENKPAPKKPVDKSNYMKGSPVESAPKIQVSNANKRSDREKQELRDLLSKVPFYESDVYLYLSKHKMTFDTISEATFQTWLKTATDLLTTQGSNAAA